MKEGIKEGIQNRNLAIAKNMLKEGESIEKIVKYTGLSEHAIEEIKKKIGRFNKKP